MKIGAGIVTYQPDLDRFRENLNAVMDQVDFVVCVDNGSKNIAALKTFLAASTETQKVTLIENRKNLGIAKALNQIMAAGQQAGAAWMLTLDQDSVAAADLIAAYRPYMDNDRIGMMTCIIQDRRAGIMVPFESGDAPYETETRIITSGCLTNVAAWAHCGGFDEKLFIDYVDIDLCQTMIEQGYQTIRINHIGLLHELGQSRKVRFLGREWHIFNHSAFRKYHIVRNNLYFIRKHAKNGLVNRRKEYKGLLLYAILVCLYEPNRRANIKAMLRGVRDARRLPL